MLLNNYSVRNLTPGKEIGASTNPWGLFRESTLRGMYMGEANITDVSNRASLPNGYGQDAWLMAPKAGGMSTSNLRGTGNLSGNGVAGLGGVLVMAGTGVFEATGGLLAGLEVTMAGSGDLTLMGGGLLQAVMALVGSGAMTNVLGATAGLTLSMAGFGTMTLAPKGTAEMELTIYVNQSEATVDQIVAGVWNALAAEYNLTGTMGEAMNGAGSAGNPWITDLSAYNTANTAGKILKDRLSKGQFIALK